MPHDSEELTLPKCLFCSRRREGQRRTFWGGFHLSTKERRPFLSSTTTVISHYRDMKRVGVFACHACARRVVRRASLPTIVIAALCAVGCGVAAVFITGALFRWGAVAGAALAGLTAVAYAAMSLFPNLDSWTSDAIIRDKAAPLLKAKGKGDSSFTEREYELLFTKKPPDRPETAEELLEGIEDEPERPRKARGAGIIPADLTQCPACGKTTPAAKKCKWCKEPLP
jgi:hypothetical protein